LYFLEKFPYSIYLFFGEKIMFWQISQENKMSDDYEEVSPKRERQLIYCDAFLKYGFHYVTDEEGI
jgi:hypothetical protein